MGRGQVGWAVAAGALALVSVVGTLAGAAPARAVKGRPAPAVPELRAVRAASHPGYDRLVFQFAGSLPGVHTVAWVPRVYQDPSGRPVALGGRAFLRVLFRPATAHTSAGKPTYPGTLPTRFDLPLLRSVVKAGDFENVLTFGVGLWQRTSLHVFTLTAPPRLVVDVRVPTGPPRRLTELDNGRLVRLRIGDRTTIALRTCVSCGDRWRLQRAPTAKVVGVVSTSVVPLPHPPKTVGFPSETRWVLAARGAGTTSLELVELPPQRGAPPLARYLLRFTVTS